MTARSHGRTRALALMSVVLLVVLSAAILALGPLKGAGLLIGGLTAIATLIFPLIGLAGSIFANTCLQIAGSGHFTGLPLSLSKILGVLTLGGWIVNASYFRWPITMTPQYRMLIPLVAVIIAWDFIKPAAGVPFTGTVKVLQIVILAFLIANIAGQSEKWLIATVAALAAAMAGSGIIGILEHFLPALHIESDDPAVALGAVGAVLDRESLQGVVIKRITGGLGDANWLAYTFAAVMPLSVYWWHRYRGFYARSLTIVVFALQGIGLVFSFTRTGIFGLAVAVFYLLWKRVIPVRPTLAAAFVVLAVSFVYLPQGFVERVFSLQYLQEGSTPLRVLLVERAVEIWLESPLTGHGYNGYGPRFYADVRSRLPDDPRLLLWADDLERSVEEGREQIENIGTHNLYLEVLVEYGIIGLTLYLGFLYLVFRDLSWVERHGRPDQRLLAICLAAGLIAFATCGMLGHAKFLKVAWMIAGLAAALRRIATIGDSPARTLLSSGNQPVPTPSKVR